MTAEDSVVFQVSEEAGGERIRFGLTRTAVLTVRSLNLSSRLVRKLPPSCRYIIKSSRDDLKTVFTA